MTKGKKAVPPGNLTLRPRYRHRRLENNRTAKVPIKALSPAMLWASTSASSSMRSLSFVQARHFRLTAESPPTRKLPQNVDLHVDLRGALGAP
jgi:hypothetical protein